MTTTFLYHFAIAWLAIVAGLTLGWVGIGYLAHRRERRFARHLDTALDVIAEPHPQHKHYCLSCPDRPLVEDFRAHSLLVHNPRRPFGPDDDPTFLKGLR